MLQNLMGASDKYYNGSETLRDKHVYEYEATTLRNETYTKIAVLS